MWYLKVSETTPKLKRASNELKEADIKYPVILIGSKEEFDQFKALIIECELKGLNPFIRCLKWWGFDDTPTFKEILDEMDSLKEISQETYDVITRIPHLSPIRDGIEQLQKYLRIYNVSGKESD